MSKLLYNSAFILYFFKSNQWKCSLIKAMLTFHPVSILLIFSKYSHLTLSYILPIVAVEFHWKISRYDQLIHWNQLDFTVCNTITYNWKYCLYIIHWFYLKEYIIHFVHIFFIWFERDTRLCDRVHSRSFWNILHYSGLSLSLWACAWTSRLPSRNWSEIQNPENKSGHRIPHRVPTVSTYSSS